MVGVAPLDVTNLAEIGSELISLVLILASFMFMAFLVYRARTIKSFQFQMFVVLLVLTVAEVPHILSDMGVLNVSGIEEPALYLHALSMLFLTGFIALRVARYFKQGGAPK